MTTNAGLGQTYMRGIGTHIINVGTDRSVAVHVDGVYQTRATASIQDMFDIDRVEVVRGPQSTLSGRTATGGAINVPECCEEKLPVILLGSKPDRPDAGSAEVEEEAHALLHGVAEQVEVCVAAQAKFLGAHLGTWVDLFAQSLALNTEEAPYLPLANFTAAFVQAEAARLGVVLIPRNRKEVKHTPYDTDFSCAACPIVDLVR